MERIKKNIESLKPLKKQSRVDEFKSTLKRLRSKEFLKPFLFLNLILDFGLDWAGFPAMAFYMHTVLKQVEIPLDEYWVAVGLSGYRSCLTIGLSFILYKVGARKIRSIFNLTHNWFETKCQQYFKQLLFYGLQLGKKNLCETQLRFEGQKSALTCA